MANPGLFLVYFHPFLDTISIQIEKNVDGVLGIRTRGRKMVGADETTELWWPPKSGFVCGFNSLSSVAQGSNPKHIIQATLCVLILSRNCEIE